jgi:transposase
MGKSTTPSFILELGLKTNAHESAALNKRFDAARQLYNTCLGEAKRRLSNLRQSKEFQYTRRMPRTINGKPNKERTEAFKKLNSTFGFSEYDLHAYATKIRNSWIGNHLDSTTTQKLATRAFKAIQRIAFGAAKRVRFKSKNQLKSVEGKTNKTGIRYNEKKGYVEWNSLHLKCIIDVNDEVVVHGLSCRVKYCRIIKRIFNGKAQFFVQLILEGKPFIKEKNKSSDNTVGLDIGPSTIAVVNDEQATVERFCDELKDKQKETRRLQRKLDRQRRANNPQNYNPDGTIKKGKKTNNDSKRYLKTKTKLAELQRKLAAHRKSLHGNLANRILKLGKHIKTEKLSYRAFQKNYGKSVKDKAPSMFVEILRRKAENAGGFVYEFPTKETKLSQYCHKCGKYIKKDLSQRVHTCCNLNIQRDIYSAFLAGSVVENNNPLTPFSKGELDTANVNKRWRSMETILQRAVSDVVQVANGRHLPSSFGLRIGKTCTQLRDRATRLRSSDAKTSWIPGIKNQNVVAPHPCTPLHKVERGRG